jgi:hypothetical protein
LRFDQTVTPGPEKEVVMSVAAVSTEMGLCLKTFVILEVSKGLYTRSKASNMAPET